MGKKKLAAGAAGLVLLAGCSAVAVRTAATPEPETCPPPLTLFESEQTASIAVLEAYISENVAQNFKHPDQLVWGSDDFNPTLTPGRIAARIMLIEGRSSSRPRYYNVALVRKCAGGEWEVVKFQPVS